MKRRELVAATATSAFFAAPSLAAASDVGQMAETDTQSPAARIPRAIGH